MRVKYTIETSWETQGYSGEIELESEDFEGLTEAERDKELEMCVGEAVANVVSWGFEVIPDA